LGKLYFDTALLPGGWTDAVTVHVAADGRIADVTVGTLPVPDAARAGIGLPGMPNLHSHAFQRGMAGLAEVGGDGADTFWTWRKVMYAFLDHLTPDDVEAIAAQLYIEMLEAGFTSVAEFHYLHHAPDGTHYADPAEMAGRIAAAAKETGIGLTLLPVLYAHGGCGGQPLQAQQRRFASDITGFAALVAGARNHVAGLVYAHIGIAPHSLRAVTPELLAEALPLAAGGPIHIHAAEQVREVEECLAWSGQRPVELLLAHGGIDQRWCLVHATHMTHEESATLARSGAVVGLCPQTESNLGDGIFDGPCYLSAGGSFGIGGDSHIRVDVAEELRTLENSQRLRDRRRNVLGAARQSTGAGLYRRALSGGAQALGLARGRIERGAIADIIALAPEHPVLVGRTGDQILDSWLFTGDGRCVGAAWVAGKQVVSGGRHYRREAVAKRFVETMQRLLSKI
jgi:formimidoylglutamate deiminase